ncbi:hypothetical protein KJ554_12820 [bacterium]|nr:hypothetical protein [bacterium]
MVTIADASDATTVLVFTFPLEGPPADGSALSAEDLQWARPRSLERTPDGGYVPLPRRQQAVVAVPTHEAVGWEVAGCTWLVEPRAPASPRSAVTVSPPQVYRDVPLVTVIVAPEVQDGVLGSVTVVLRHAPQSRYARALKAAAGKVVPDVIGARAIVNTQLFSRLAAGLSSLRRQESAAARQSTHPFLLAGHWLELEIEQTGAHRLTGLDFTFAGVPTSQVDPGKLRLYRAWPTALPDDPEQEPATWQDDYAGLTEVALDVRDADGSWDDGDELRFYAVGPDDWSDRFVAGASPVAWQEHPYSNRTVYWLTWEDHQTATPLPGAPLRMTTQNAAAHGVDPLSIHLARHHREQSNVEAFGRLLDNWAWDTAIFNQKTVTFDIPHAVTDSAAFFMVEVRSNHHLGGSSSVENVVTVWLNDGLDSGDTVSSSWLIFYDGRPDSLRNRVAAWSPRLVEGVNSLTLRRDSPSNPPILVPPSVILDSADMMAWQDLILDSGQFAFTHWGSQVGAPGEFADLRLSYRAGRDIEIWDVSDPHVPIVMVGDFTGIPATAVTLGLTRQPDADLHLLACGEADYYEPAYVARRTPGALRGTDPDVAYVLLYEAGLAAYAAQLAAHRSADLQVEAVDVADVYDAFGGGVKDPLALRNFLKWLWLRGGGQLRYVCLLGDASRDYRHYRNQFEDLVPTVVRTNFPGLLTGYGNYPYASDDHLVSFDAPVSYPWLDLPDVAVGRLTVRDATEAQRRVDAVIAYDTDTPPGTWRNRVVLAADDFCQPSDFVCAETMHTAQAEYLIDQYVPLTIDAVKLYLADYDYDPGGTFKPRARQEAKRLWNEGLTIFHYIGHGADNTLADEQVFLTDDIFGLTNGGRRGVFTAFSCDVGIYDSATRQSMAEIFTAQENGGAIASIAASQVSYVIPNNHLSDAFYAAIYPGRSVAADVTLGAALLQAKVAMGGFAKYDDVSNSQKYNLLGDPATSLPNPASGPEFHATSVDTLHGGLREEVVCVLSDFGLSPGAGAGYDLAVLEDRQTKVASVDNVSFTFWLPGATVFHGTGRVDGDTLRIPFKVPVQLGYGEHGKVRLIIDTPEGGFAAAMQLPVVQAATGAVDDFVGPAIDLAFADDRYRVKPGTLLSGVIADTSGVSILGTSPLNSILLEFDASGFMSNVSDSFVFDSGSYTTGRLEIVLPDNLDLGDHLVALHASDVLGNVGNDTLSFQLVAGEQVSIDDVTLFPNPTSGPARLIFELSDPMSVSWSIYTLSGHLVYQEGRSFGTAGPQVMHWDGRDTWGDELANGVYLFVVRGHGFDDAGHRLDVTGKLVVMK